MVTGVIVFKENERYKDTMQHESSEKFQQFRITPKFEQKDAALLSQFTDGELRPRFRFQFDIAERTGDYRLLNAQLKKKIVDIERYTNDPRFTKYLSPAEIRRLVILAGQSSTTAEGLLQSHVTALEKIRGSHPKPLHHLTIHMLKRTGWETELKGAGYKVDYSQYSKRPSFVKRSNRVYLDASRYKDNSKSRTFHETVAGTSDPNSQVRLEFERILQSGTLKPHEATLLNEILDSENPSDSQIEAMVGILRAHPKLIKQLGHRIERLESTKQ